MNKAELKRATLSESAKEVVGDKGAEIWKVAKENIDLVNNIFRRSLMERFISVITLGNRGESRIKLTPILKGNKVYFRPKSILFRGIISNKFAERVRLGGNSYFGDIKVYIVGSEVDFDEPDLNMTKYTKIENRVEFTFNKVMENHLRKLGAEINKFQYCGNSSRYVVEYVIGGFNLEKNYNLFVESEVCGNLP